MADERPDPASDGAPDAADAILLAELAAVLREYTVPPREVVEAAKQSFPWRTVDAELAALTFDSLLDAEPVLARSAAQPRILTFEAPGLTIEVEVDTGRSARRMLGQLVPGQAAELELRSGGEVVTTGTADQLGRFTLPLPVSRQRVSLRCRLADGTEVQSATTVV